MMRPDDLSGSMLKLSDSFNRMLKLSDSHLRVVAVKGELAHSIEGLADQISIGPEGYFSTLEGVMHTAKMSEHR